MTSHAVQEIPAGYKQTEVGTIPEDWDVRTCAEVCFKIQDGTHFSPSIGGNDYLYVTSKNIGFGMLDLSNADRIDAVQHRAIYKRCDVRQGDLLLTKDGANTGNAALNTLKEEFSLLSSVAFLRFDSKRYAAGYFLQQILSNPGQRRIKDAMAGNAITRLTLEKIRSLRFSVAPLPDQRAIAEALSDADVLIEGLTKLVAKKRAIKQGAMQELLTGKRRLPGFSGKWEVKKLGKLLGYERPDRYIVKSTDYQDNAKIPVLTANKSFVLGYTNEEFGVYRDLPAIIFDDFTTDSKYVDVSFKVKSSAIKILKSKSDDITLKFVYERMQLINFPLGGHKRYYISEYQHLEVPTPKPEEQTAIAGILSDMDAEIDALEQRLAKYKQLKQGMMQVLLTGKIRLLTR